LRVQPLALSGLPLRRQRFLVVALLVTAVALAANLSPSQAHADPFISVSMTFTNAGQLPLYRHGGQLDHGCWTNNVLPPDTIPPLTTVNFEAESCGVATGTEGFVEYRPYGSPASQFGHFYFDDPFIGDNAASASGPSGCTVSHTDPPTSGDNISVFYTMGCSASTDDGIADVWKLHGAEFDPGGGAQSIDLPSMGATVGQKDIFVQIDWMQGNQAGQFNQQIIANAIKRWVNLYAANGFSLHVDQGPSSVLNFATNATWGSLAKGQALAYQANLGTATVDPSGNLTKYDWTAFNNIKSTNFTPTGRGPIFHYVLAAHQLGNVGNSGISQNPGVDVIISLGTFTSGVGSENEQLATLLHEFGHNLGLGHGGQDNVNYKPNYLSVMNYAFQFAGVTKNGVTTYDYSHNADTTLNEVNPPGLNEASGVPSAPGDQTVHYCPAVPAGPGGPGAPAARLTVANAAGPIDWNCDGTTNASPVSADVNGDPAQPANTLGTLTGYEDWSHLNLKVGGIGSFGAGFAPPPLITVIDDPTPQMVQQVLPVDTVAPVSTAQALPAPNAAGWNNTDVTITVTATDDSSGVARIEDNLDGAGFVQYTAAVVVSAEGNHTLLYRAIDRGSNVESAKSLSFKIDKTKPMVTYTGAQATYSILDTVSITCSASDPLSGGVASGVASTTCQNITGPAYNLDPTNSFSASATDFAGNTGTGSVSFQVVVTYADLCTLGKRFVTNSGLAQANGMCAQLDAAQAANARGNLTAKANAINAYLNRVDAGVNGGYLSPQNAAILKKWANLL
jgi:YD repeat-containing protein